MRRARVCVQSQLHNEAQVVVVSQGGILTSARNVDVYCATDLADFVLGDKGGERVVFFEELGEFGLRDLILAGREVVKATLSESLGLETDVLILAINVLPEFGVLLHASSDCFFVTVFLQF